MKVQLQVYAAAQPRPTKSGGHLTFQRYSIIDDDPTRPPLLLEFRHFKLEDVKEPGIYEADVRFYSRQLPQRNNPDYTVTAPVASFSNLKKVK